MNLLTCTRGDEQKSCLLFSAGVGQSFLLAEETARLQGAGKEQEPQAAAMGISLFEKIHHGSRAVPECQEALDYPSMWIFGI